MRQQQTTTNTRPEGPRWKLPVFSVTVTCSMNSFTVCAAAAVCMTDCSALPVCTLHFLVLYYCAASSGRVIAEKAVSSLQISGNSSKLLATKPIAKWFFFLCRRLCLYFEIFKLIHLITTVVFWPLCTSWLS